jgi:hypothetical protein
VKGISLSPRNDLPSRLLAPETTADIGEDERVGDAAPRALAMENPQNPEAQLILGHPFKGGVDPGHTCDQTARDRFDDICIPADAGTAIQFKGATVGQHKAELADRFPGQTLGDVGPQRFGDRRGLARLLTKGQIRGIFAEIGRDQGRQSLQGPTRPARCRRRPIFEQTVTDLHQRQTGRAGIIDDALERGAEGEALPDEAVHQIADRTDGVPLFIEELTKSVLESGVQLMGIPTTLHDSLMARLDRLASVRPVAQIGAAIGREFSYALLRAVSQVSEHELQAALGRLAASELVFQRGTPPDAVYSFNHALVQDVAHASLLRATRQQLHAQIADALETQSPEVGTARQFFSSASA